MNKNPSQPEDKMELVQNICTIINQARSQVRQTVNAAMVLAYWQIGRLIIEDEQVKQERAGYGQQLLKRISEQLTQEYGKGFDVTNLRNMRRFYLVFQKRETLSLELSWSHYNRLARIENRNARECGTCRKVVLMDGVSEL